MKSVLHKYLCKVFSRVFLKTIGIIELKMIDCNLAEQQKGVIYVPSFALWQMGYTFVLSFETPEQVEALQ